MPETPHRGTLLDWFRPKWRHSDPAVRKDAVERLTDQVVLSELARTDGDNAVRRAAIGRLSSSTLLEQIVRTDPDYDTAGFAIGCLNDPNVLARIAMLPRSEKDKNTFPSRQTLAASRIHDELLLAQLSRPESGAGPAVRWMVADRVKDSAVLVQLAERDPAENVRKKAVQRLEDSAALVRIAITDSHEDICREALGRITHQNQIAEVARRSVHSLVRGLAAGRVESRPHAEELLGAYRALGEACASGALERVSEMLADGLDPNASLDQGDTVYALAVRHGHLELIEELRRRGADPARHREVLGRYLWSAIDNRDSEAALHLIRHGANPNTTGAPPHYGDGYSVLQFAIMRNMSQVAQALVDNGAGLNHDAGFWETPEYGASVYHSCTILDVAGAQCREPHWDGFVEMLVARGAKHGG